MLSPPTSTGLSRYGPSTEGLTRLPELTSSQLGWSVSGHYYKRPWGLLSTNRSSYLRDSYSAGSTSPTFEGYLCKPRRKDYYISGNDWKPPPGLPPTLKMLQGAQEPPRRPSRSLSIVQQAWADCGHMESLRSRKNGSSEL